MYKSMDERSAEVRASLPEPGNDAIGRLRHTVAAFANCTTPEEWAIRATGNIYGDGVTTGLKWGDLQAILTLLDKAGITIAPAAPAPESALAELGHGKPYTLAMPGAMASYLEGYFAKNEEDRDVVDAFNKGLVIHRGRYYVRLITANAPIMWVFRELAQSILNEEGVSWQSEKRAARKWIKDMRDTGL